MQFRYINGLYFINIMMNDVQSDFYCTFEHALAESQTHDLYCPSSRNANIEHIKAFHNVRSVSSPLQIEWVKCWCPKENQDTENPLNSGTPKSKPPPPPPQTSSNKDWETAQPLMLCISHITASTTGFICLFLSEW